jgi:nicotinamidase-related amidase
VRGAALRLDRNTALLVVDMQTGFADPAWGPRNNPGLEANVAALIAAWRETAAPLFHVHHESPSPAGLLRRGTPGNAPMPEALPLAGEQVYRKTVNSAFVGTTLRADLRRLGIDTIVIVGLTTNHCISTTARMAGNLGFETFVVADATAAFARAALDGRIRPAEEVHMDALSDLQGEFAGIVTTAQVLEEIEAPAGWQAEPRRAGGRSPGLY